MSGVVNTSFRFAKFAKITRLFAPGEKSACLIMLHGLAGSAAGWTQETRKLQMMIPHMAAILPTARFQPVTVLKGQKTTCWHDIYSLDEIDAKKCTGLDESMESISELIFEEIKSGTPSERIVIAGFSQGGAMALYTAYQLNVELAGVVALSGYLPDADNFHDYMKDASRVTPCLICHGTRDDTIKIEAGRKASEVLKNNSVPVQFYGYEGMGYEVCPNELDDVSMFISERLQL